MVNEPKQNRRDFLGTAALTIAAARVGGITPASFASVAGQPQDRLMARAPFGPVKQIDAGLLDVGYVEVGPNNGQPVVLLHGWPYDIYSYGDVAPTLGAAGYRVVVPFLRGYGTTRFRSANT